MRRGLFLAFASLIIAVSTYTAHLWVIVLEGSLKDFSPPFRGKLPFDAPTTPLVSKATLLVVEGISPDDLPRMEYLSSLREKGAYIPLDTPCTFGYYTRWAMLFTGATPDIIGIYPQPSPIPPEHLFEAIKRSGLRTAFTGPYFWQEIIASPDEYFYASFFAGEDEPDRIAEQSCRFIRQFQPDFTFIHLTGFTRPRYADVLIRRIGETLDLNGGVLAVLLLSVRGNALLLIGRDVKSGIYERASITDVAPTLAALLGAPIPPGAQGHILIHSLSMPVQVQAEKLVALARQRVNLADLYLVELTGRGLEESIKGDAVIAQSSLEVKNYRAALELARLAVEGADRTMAEARVRLVRSGQWRRLPFVAGIALGFAAAFIILGRGLGVVSLLGGALSVALNAYAFQQQMQGIPFTNQTFPLPGAPLRTLMALALPALLPLIWVALEGKHHLDRMLGALTGYILAAVYITWLVVLFCFWQMGVAVTWPLPPLLLYWIYGQALWQVILSGVMGLVVVFPAMLATGIRTVLGYLRAG